MRPRSLVARLIEGLDAIVAVNDDLMDASTIDYDEYRMEKLAAEGIIMAAPKGEWGPTNDRQQQLQRELLGAWGPWWEQTQLLFSSDPPENRRKLEEAGERVSTWLNRWGTDFSIPATTEEAKAVFRQHVEPLRELLRSHAPAGDRVIVVPDTNVLIRGPDITKYGSVLDTDSYTVFLVPGVLAELDSHKVNHGNPAVREKARKFGKRLKGWRTQGSLSSGVKVQGDIFVQVDGREPNFENTLSWLDPSVTDDRIVASILEIQRRFPTTEVVLLTGDMVMLAKADLASVPTAETPDPDV